MHRYYKVDRSEICGTVACTMHPLPKVTESGLLPYFMQDVAKITFYRKASGQTTCVLMSGAIGTLIDIFRFLQVESIASMFDLDPNRPIWIVKKSGNIAVWPQGGQFSGPLVVPSAVYDVRGHLPSTAEGAATSSAGSGQLDTTSPFGAYTSLT